MKVVNLHPSSLSSPSGGHHYRQNVYDCLLKAKGDILVQKNAPSFHQRTGHFLYSRRLLSNLNRPGVGYLQIKSLEIWESNGQDIAG